MDAIASIFVNYHEERQEFVAKTEAADLIEQNVAEMMGVVYRGATSQIADEGGPATHQLVAATLLIQFVVLPRKMGTGRDSLESDENVVTCFIDAAATLKRARKQGLLRPVAPRPLNARVARRRRRFRTTSIAVALAGPPVTGRSSFRDPSGSIPDDLDPVARRLQFDFVLMLCRRLGVKDVFLFATEAGAPAWLTLGFEHVGSSASLIHLRFDLLFKRDRGVLARSARGPETSRLAAARWTARSRSSATPRASTPWSAVQERVAEYGEKQVVRLAKEAANAAPRPRPNDDDKRVVDDADADDEDEAWEPGRPSMMDLDDDEQEQAAKAKRKLKRRSKKKSAKAKNAAGAAPHAPRRGFEESDNDDPVEDLIHRERIRERDLLRTPGCLALGRKAFRLEDMPRVTERDREILRRRTRRADAGNDLGPSTRAIASFDAFEGFESFAFYDATRRRNCGEARGPAPREWALSDFGDTMTTEAIRARFDLRRDDGVLFRVFSARLEYDVSPETSPSYARRPLMWSVTRRRRLQRLFPNLDFRLSWSVRFNVVVQTIDAIALDSNLELTRVDMEVRRSTVGVYEDSLACQLLGQTYYVHPDKTIKITVDLVVTSEVIGAFPRPRRPSFHALARSFPLAGTAPGRAEVHIKELGFHFVDPLAPIAEKEIVRVRVFIPHSASRAGSASRRAARVLLDAPQSFVRRVESLARRAHERLRLDDGHLIVELKYLQAMHVKNRMLKKCCYTLYLVELADRLRAEASRETLKTARKNVVEAEGDYQLALSNYRQQELCSTWSCSRPTLARVIRKFANAIARKAAEARGETFVPTPYDETAVDAVVVTAVPPVAPVVSAPAGPPLKALEGMSTKQLNAELDAAGVPKTGRPKASIEILRDLATLVADGAKKVVFKYQNGKAKAGANGTDYLVARWRGLAETDPLRLEFEELARRDVAAAAADEPPVDRLQRVPDPGLVNLPTIWPRMRLPFRAATPRRRATKAFSRVQVDVNDMETLRARARMCYRVIRDAKRRVANNSKPRAEDDQCPAYYGVDYKSVEGKLVCKFTVHEGTKTLAMKSAPADRRPPRSERLERKNRIAGGAAASDPSSTFKPEALRSLENAFSEFMPERFYGISDDRDFMCPAGKFLARATIPGSGKHAIIVFGTYDPSRSRRRVPGVSIQEKHRISEVVVARIEEVNVARAEAEKTLPPLHTAASTAAVANFYRDPCGLLEPRALAPPGQPRRVAKLYVVPNGEVVSPPPPPIYHVTENGERLLVLYATRVQRPLIPAIQQVHKQRAEFLSLFDESEVEMAAAMFDSRPIEIARPLLFESEEDAERRRAAAPSASASRKKKRKAAAAAAAAAAASGATRRCPRDGASGARASAEAPAEALAEAPPTAPPVEAPAEAPPTAAAPAKKKKKKRSRRRGPAPPAEISEYERTRMRNIAAGNKKLYSLGLIHPPPEVVADPEHSCRPAPQPLAAPPRKIV
ncbi:hypothetical protein JL720_3494 [Aureococcus anophagefferens]|nr:hypothetical protein JL720_3494 [Aureococcus anophagefferens]